ncbi:ankyrin repeat domain-containing protein [Halarcobacter bivalviorum]|uniref:ankyrin repeat domain-containing protein n=1 Tax=Halarcobacter bivalviorum TaxID=663364 RepID=UPI00100B6D86|nr:ankyrin repeat domain-containing protein [Halarcobacter bivalviorum]RXK05334.1 hypothetical protein CRU97_08295 [Halarcobacter bivalviorum]
MIGKLFKKTADDLIEEIKSKDFNESKADSILEHININHTNQNLQNFLHIATLENKPKAVKWLLKNKINVREVDGEGQTALLIASKYNYIECIEELIKYDVDVNRVDYDKTSAIEYIIENNLVDIYKKIKHKVTDVNKKNHQGLTLLQVAIKNKSIEIVEDLLDNPNLENKHQILFYNETFLDEEIFKLLIPRFDKFSTVDEHQRNALFYIVENGIKSKKLFAPFTQIVDVDHVDEKGNNILLHLLSIVLEKEKNIQNDLVEDFNEAQEELENLIQMIPLVANSGINFETCNYANETAISLPVKYKSIRVLNLLLDCEIDINIKNRDRQTALSQSIIRDSSYMEINHVLIDFGADPNIKDKDSVTAIERLIEAILTVKSDKKPRFSEISSDTDYITLLEAVLQNTNANLTMLNSKREPYFFEALRYGNFDLIKLLIKHGADVNQTDMEGVHVLYKYMEEGLKEENELKKKKYYENLGTILLLGANVNATDSFGGVVLHKAILNLDINVVRILMKNGANLKAVDNKGRHMLHNSVWKNDLKMFKYIYAHCQEQLNKPDKFGVLPINYAAFLGYSKIVSEMIQLEAHINNPHKKTKYILTFLKKFHDNLPKLLEETKDRLKKEKVTKLIENMKKEFEVID